MRQRLQKFALLTLPFDAGQNLAQHTLEWPGCSGQTTRIVARWPELRRQSLLQVEDGVRRTRGGNVVSVDARWRAVHVLPPAAGTCMPGCSSWKNLPSTKVNRRSAMAANDGRFVISTMVILPLNERRPLLSARSLA